LHIHSFGGEDSRRYVWSEVGSQEHVLEVLRTIPIQIVLFTRFVSGISLPDTICPVFITSTVTERGLRQIQNGIFPQQVLVHELVRSAERIHVLVIRGRSREFDDRTRPVRLHVESLLAAKIEVSAF
jgi:hypothetical protein